MSGPVLIWLQDGDKLLEEGDVEQQVVGVPRVVRAHVQQQSQQPAVHGPLLWHLRVPVVVERRSHCASLSDEQLAVRVSHQVSLPPVGEQVQLLRVGHIRVRLVPRGLLAPGTEGLRSRRYLDAVALVEERERYLKPHHRQGVVASRVGGAGQAQVLLGDDVGEGNVLHISYLGAALLLDPAAHLQLGLIRAVRVDSELELLVPHPLPLLGTHTTSVKHLRLLPGPAQHDVYMSWLSSHSS
eukprot:755091-Hanusia_phi.AAC.2